MEYRDRILGMAKVSPLLPVQVAKALNTNSLFASAMLSELTSKGLLKVSNLKLGSSPLYYLPEFSGQLQAYADKLNVKDKATYDLLKEKKVLREKELDPLTRVSVKSIKDFSRPLEVTFNEQREIFWKWFLLSDQDAEIIIKQLLNIEAPKQEEQKIQETVAQKALPAVNTVEHMHAERSKRISRQKKLVEQQVKEPVAGIQKDTPKKIVPRKEKDAEPVREDLFAAVENTAGIKDIKDNICAGAAQEQAVSFVPADSSDVFLKQLLSFFQKNSIRVIEQKVIKKKADYEFIVELNSVVGSLTYFCKAKNKKRVSEGDLSSAFVQGQLKKLPVLVITPGELTKQAQEIAKVLKGVAVKMLDGS